MLRKTTIGSDIRGTTAVEFSLIAVPFLAILAMIFDTGLAYFFERNLDAAVQNAARQIRTGAVQAASTPDALSFVKSYVCPATGSMLGSFIDCTKLVVDVRTATSFTGNDLTNDFYKTQGTNLFCPGAPSTITIVRVTYPMPWFIPVMTVGSLKVAVNNAGLVNDAPTRPGTWSLLLTSVALARTEPYPNGQYTKNKGC